MSIKTVQIILNDFIHKHFLRFIDNFMRFPNSKTGYVISKFPFSVLKLATIYDD